VFAIFPLKRQKKGETFNKRGWRIVGAVPWIGGVGLRRDLREEAIANGNIGKDQ